MTPPSDLDLVQHALAGDERAMRLLWARHAPRVDAVVRRLVGDPDRAADVAQEVWIQIFRALPGWRGDAQFGTWLHRVAVNRTLNAIRSDRRRERVETSLDAAAGGADDGAGEAALARAVEAATAVQPEGDRGLLAAAIEAAAARLAPGARQVFLLHDVEGWTHEEIAAQLGITAGGSKSQLFKARARLRQLLAPLVDDRPAHAARSAGDRPPPRGGGRRHGAPGPLGPAGPAPG
ncbi:MAG TPA: sigma-70 family RNA polymerase sigma factor, partial [Gemmatirosa sp.]|nr:sigma-70 family RNA polymerase sigma factor [Gemmatirosa sp.]